MSTVEIVTRVCDMPHREDVEAKPFELYSKAAGAYEVDLCEGCAARIFAPAVKNGRKIKVTRRR